MIVRRNSFVFLLSCLLALAAPRAAAQCVSLTTMGSAATQNFNTLSNTAGSTTNNLTLTGWFMTETGGGARDNDQYGVDTGGSNTGDTYSYGAAGNTERALGALQSGTLIPVIGACFTNNTGGTITSLDVSYNGEQWRIGNTAAARDDRLDFQHSDNATSLATGTWTDVNALDFTNPIKTAGTAAALDGNNAANRTAVVHSIPSLSIANGATFWIRWNDLNASGADDGLAIDDFSLTPQSGPVLPTLNISDVTLGEGDAGTTTFEFAVTLTAPAGPGGVTFDIATADNTATTADNDYVANSLTGQSIPMGSTGTYNFNVVVNGDTTTESNQTFFVNVTSITGANAGDAQATGTIVNDDVTITPIHDIQGPGNSSPIVGASVTTRGIVTGVRSNGFFIQEPDASVDADPATSEAVLVFTNAAPPAAAVVGNLVQVSATVVEFVPSQDPLQPPLTELSSPVVVQLSSGNPLPAAIPLTATFPDPAGPVDQLERLEGMRVSVASLTVVAPTDGNVNEPNAASTSTGDFYGVVTGVARPFREPGIQAPDPAPSGGSIPPIPRWDANPETLRVDNGLTGSPILDVSTGAAVTGLVGPLDYAFRRYTILPEPAPTAVPVVSGGSTATNVAAATTREFTIAAYNLERFFDDANDPSFGEPVLTAAAFSNRLDKASLGIRNHLGTPDIVGILEIENLATLQALATRISNDAIAVSQPDPQYVAYLVEGNDVGAIDSGFLVKTAPAFGATPRVTVNAVVQELDGTVLVNPDSSTDILHDRPPLRLDAVINHANGATFPVTVIAVHNRSLNDVESEDPGANGWPTSGARIRAKRQAQAEDVANLLQSRQTADPAETIVVLGDFNAFEFNDGYVDAMNTINGTPSPDNETAVPGDGIDLVNPDFDNLGDTAPAAERYSYLYDGQAQNLDHVLVNQALIDATIARRIEHPRINADFPEIDRSDASTARRLADHDPVIGFFEVAAFATSDVSITKSDNVDPANAGQNFFYTVTVDNAGPDAADNVSWSDPLPTDTTFVSLSAPGGWSCTTPAVGANGTITCSAASLGVGSAAFNLTVAVDAGLASGSILSNTATVTTTTADANGGNDNDTETTTVTTSADLQLSKTDSPDPVNAGENLSYQITLTNNGPSNGDATFTDTLPAGTTFVSLSTTGPWSCTTPAVGASGTITCTNAAFGVTVDFFTLVVNVDPTTAEGTVLSNTATLSATTPDPNGANNSDTATTTVATAADLQVTKLDSPDPVTAGNDLTYTIDIANAGPSAAAGVVVTDTIPAGTTFVSLASSGDFNCTTPPVGANGLVTCTKASPLLPGETASFTLVVNVDGATPSGTVLTNIANVTSSTTETNAANNSATVTTTTGGGSADVSVTKTDAPDPVQAGANLTYTITVTNAGPSNAASVAITDTIPAGTTFDSLVSPAGWSCTTPATGATGAIDCSTASLATTTAAFTLTVNVDPSLATGTVLTNGVAVTTATPDPNEANNSASTTTTVVSSTDLQLNKVGSPDPVTAGNDITYVIDLANAGPSDAAGVVVTDSMPAGTTFVSLASSSIAFDCTTPAVGGTGLITCSHSGAFLNGAAASLTLVVNVSDTTPSGTILTNTANVTSSATETNAENNSATATTTVGVGSSDLSVTKTDAPDPVTAGSNVTYTITVANAGPSSAASVALSESVPAGTTFVSLLAPAGWSCTTPAVGATGPIDCTVASFGATSDVFTLVVETDPALPTGSVLTNNASVSAATADPNGANDAATASTTVTTAADLQLTKVDTPDPVTAGNDLTYTIDVANAGPSDADGVVVTDTIPANTTFVSMSSFADFNCATPSVGGTGLITCTKASPLAAGGGGSFALVVNVNGATPAGTVITNSASITSTTAETNASNNSATATTTAGSGSADLSVTKTGSPDPVDAGSTLTYTITVANAGPSDATSVTLHDTLPVATTFVSLASPAGWTCTTPASGATGAIDCSIASLGVTSAVFTLVVSVDPALAAGSVVSNTATVTSATNDPNEANDGATEATIVTASADLQLSKTDAPDPVTAGDPISYQLTLTNNGPANAANATFTDTLPAGVTFVSLSTTGSWSCTTPAAGATGTIACTNPDFGVTVDFFTIVVRVDPALASGTVLTNTATLASTTTDPDPSNNSSTTTTTVGVGSADLSIAKSAPTDPVNAGADLTYTIDVTNAGPTNAASVTMTDTLPAETTFVSLTAPAGWTCTTPAVGAAGTVSCTNPSLASGSATFTLTARVADGTTSGTVITNTATVASTTADPNPGDETATATSSVLSPAAVTGTKSVTGTFEPNGSITYTIVLTNSGPSMQQDNAGDELLDILPASLTLVSAGATDGAALANVATNTVTWNGAIASGDSVTITINATIRADTTPGTSVSNQGTIQYDADGNGTNESSAATDSPAAGGTTDATVFIVGAAPAAVAQIPTLDELALLALAALLAGVAMMLLKR